jgi:hypothetical protein
MVSGNIEWIIIDVTGMYVLERQGHGAYQNLTYQLHFDNLIIPCLFLLGYCKTLITMEVLSLWELPTAIELNS